MSEPTTVLFYIPARKIRTAFAKRWRSSSYKFRKLRLRVVAPDVGGGFGMKGDTYPEEGIVLLASQIVGRPVKWVSGRNDAFVLDSAGRDQVIDAEMALDAYGHVLAIRAKALHNLGAYIAGAALVPLCLSPSN